MDKWGERMKEKNKIEKIEITKEMFESCKIPESKNSVTITYENGDEYYEDETYIGWNGACVKKEVKK